MWYIIKPLSNNITTNLNRLLKSNSLFENGGCYIWQMAPSRAFRLPPPLLRYVHRVNSARKSVKPRHIVYATATTTLAAGATITLGFAGLALSGAHDAIVTLPSDLSGERI